MTQTMSERIKAARLNQAPHLIVEARAGTGKTTTLISSLKNLKGETPSITPSALQVAIWDAIALSANARTICFVAFNKSIASELERKVPAGCEAMTMHSMGYRAVRAAWNLQKGSKAIQQYKVRNIIETITKRSWSKLETVSPGLGPATEKLVSLCKSNLVGDYIKEEYHVESHELDALASHYDVDLQNEASKVFELVPQVLTECADIGKHACIDFDDMIWLPIVHDLNIFTYDLLLVDESQDLNPCQQELAIKAGDRLILVGDPKQAIYGFAGADAKSIENMFNRLRATTRGCDRLPLNITYRCGKAIVKHVNRLVPDLVAHDNNPAGWIGEANFRKDGENDESYHDLVEPGDMILCRVNAPLVSECFKFLKAGRRANIQGRDIGAGLLKLIERLTKGFESDDDAEEMRDLKINLEQWHDHEVELEMLKKFASESKIIALGDKYDCLCCFCDECDSVDDLKRKINSVFTNDANQSAILLSSGHKAKGLEAERVFILEPDGATCPHPMARSAWQMDQEWNLRYVMETRAIEDLYFVS